MNPSTNRSLFSKLAGFVVMAVMLVLGLMFSVALLAIALIIGLGAFGYFWWKTRALRKIMEQQVAAQVPRYGAVIEGEAVVVDDGTQTRP